MLRETLRFDYTFLSDLEIHFLEYYPLPFGNNQRIHSLGLQSPHLSERRVFHSLKRILNDLLKRFNMLNIYKSLLF